jgi:hypothetical protein
MTTRKDLPEEATEEPRIRSTAEEAERAAKRQEVGEHLETAEEARHLGDPDNPLRIPGELSSKPLEDPPDARAAEGSRGSPDDEEEPVE